MDGVMHYPESAKKIAKDDADAKILARWSKSAPIPIANVPKSPGRAQRRRMRDLLAMRPPPPPPQLPPTYVLPEGAMYYIEMDPPEDELANHPILRRLVAKRRREQSNRR